MSAIVRSSEEPSGRRRDVLRVLKAAPGPMSITAIADELGVHPNTVRFHLDTLVSDGRVEQCRAGPQTAGAPAADVSCDPDRWIPADRAITGCSPRFSR